MKKFISATALTSLAFVTACSSIANTNHDKIQILTTPASQSTCTARNELSESTVYSPNRAKVHRSKTDVKVDCVDNATGATGTTTAKSSLDPWLLGNILIGGLIGVGVDFGWGGAWDYPSSVNVPLSTPAAIAQPVPQTSYVPAAPAGSPQFGYTPAPTTAQPTYVPAPAGAAPVIVPNPTPYYVAPTPVR